uniref:Uncharacterized protein n=1 Tax=Brassica oleracea var. oleracea TaxID=109376 RepID=A0A0D3E2T0_BRAOL
MPTLCRGWHYQSNHLSDKDGRIVLIWKDPVKLRVVTQSRQMITCEITLPACASFLFTTVYASNLSEERTDLWVELLSLHSSLDLGTKTWLLGGDFNQILHRSEHSAFNENSSMANIYEFRDCLLQLGVFHLRYQGATHTWSNKQPSTPVAKKLDRCLINNNVITAFPHATATFLPTETSDHSPCLIDLAFQLPKAGTQPYKFQNYLTKHPSFTEVVREAWFEAGSFCVNLASLCWKLKCLKKTLKQLNRENYSNIVERVKEQGGLGVKDLYSWNRACILKLIWLLFFRPDSVWVCWYKEVILKGSLSNYWTINTSPTNSWLANKLIKCRDLVFPLIKRRLGNGQSTRFWYDNWSPFGNLTNYLNASTRRLGIPKDATVSSLFDNDHWNLPPARTEQQLALQIHLTTVILSSDDDSYDWEVNGKMGDRFSTGDIYTYTIGPKQMVPWASVVWCPYGIPRQSFLTWLVHLDRCPMKDRLLRWGLLGVDPVCLLCNSGVESRNHLFFDCAYSRLVWFAVANRCQLQPSTDWDSTINQLQSLGGNKDLRRLTILAFQATTYWLWNERNTRLHQQTFRSQIR